MSSTRSDRSASKPEPLRQTTRGTTDNILAKFPLEGCQPRPSQGRYIQATHEAFQRGARFVILEAPVGSGKSASAMTLAKQYGSSHTLTPRKALQDQYFADFHSFTQLMKGKKSYPCTKHDPSVNVDVYEEIEEGKTPSPDKYSSGISVAEGWCRGKKSRFNRCTKQNGTCPYTYAAEVAERSAHIIHNIHGFLFQAGLAGKFTERELLIVDEAHDLESCLRDYFTVEFKLPRSIAEVPRLNTVGEYVEFFAQPVFMPRDADDAETYLEQLLKLQSFEHKDDVFVVDVRRDDFGAYARLIPRRFSHLVDKVLWRFGSRVVCMSGTVCDRRDFCRRLGIPEKEAVFIKVDSDFPTRYRPVIMKSEYLVDTSHAKWDENFGQLVSVIETILTKIPGEKGLIHTPSYSASKALIDALRARGNTRVVGHTPETTYDALMAFYASKEPLVFLSPTCQQGVDFKDDRARFQVIIRVPYLNAGDLLVNTMMKEDFHWYNLQAVRAFGQQLGRINRHEKDFGTTILIDSRFPSFIRKNRNLLANDLSACLITD